MDIERGIDGMIGRMLSWLVQAPVRSAADIGQAAGSEVEPIEQDLVGLEKKPLPAVVKPESPENGATVAKRRATKQSPAKRTTARKAAPRKLTAKKPAAKKATSRKSAAKKPVAKKAPARKSTAKKPAAKKAAVRKPVAKTAPKSRARKKVTARAATLDAFVDAAEQAVPKGGGAALEKADEPLERFVERAERPSGEDENLREKLLAALSASAEGASLAELRSKTGDTLANVRRQLNQLQETGRVQRGKGIGTRYHLT